MTKSSQKAKLKKQRYPQDRLNSRFSHFENQVKNVFFHYEYSNMKVEFYPSVPPCGCPNRENPFLKRSLKLFFNSGKNSILMKTHFRVLFSQKIHFCSANILAFLS